MSLLVCLLLCFVVLVLCSLLGFFVCLFFHTHAQCSGVCGSICGENYYTINPFYKFL